MKKHSNARHENDDLEISELGPEFFAKAEMGRYYAKMMANSNVVRIAPELSEAFPNEVSVNQALRELLQLRQALSQIESLRPKRRKTA